MLAGEHSHDTGLGPSLGPPPLLAAGLLACRFCTPFKLDKAVLPAAELPVCPCRPLPAVPGPGSADGKSSRERARAPRFPSHPRAAAGRLPAPDSSQRQPAARQSLSRVSTGGASRLSSSPRLHRGSPALTSLPRVLLRHSLNPTARNAVHVLCISCFFPPSFRGWKQQQQKAPSVSPAGRAVCSSPGCHGQL